MKSVTIILLFLFSTNSLIAQNKDSVEGDLDALVDLYSATNGGNWSNNSGWLDGNPSNNWYGVEVNSDGRVIKLDLYSNNLSGELPESIGNLSKLKFFSVKDNPIYSKIPSSIANWIDMEILLFSSNQGRKVRYNIPDLNIANSHPGKTPNASVAKYYGVIPDVFDKMPNLRMLEIAWSTDFEPQSYPSTLYDKPSLEALTLTGNNLEGELLDSFNLPNIRILLLGNNNWSGSIPSSLGNSTLVIKFVLSNSDYFSSQIESRLSGSLPNTFASFTALKYFYLQNQNLGGEIPGFMIENWSKDPRDGLREINISGNSLTGEIPKEFGNFNLTVFSLKNNNFSGTIHPNIVSGMQNVVLFNIKLNNLSGDFPNGQMVNGEWKGWRTKTRLRTLTLDHNNFTGPLPDMPEYVGDMSLITLHRNNFEGGIPETWKELFTPELRNENTDRTFNNLQLRGNRLEGVIPEWFTRENGPTGDVGGNKWTHKDILENGVDVGFQSNTLSENEPKPFGNRELQSIPSGGTFTFDYSPRVHFSDEVQWTKNGSPIPGATSPVLTIESVKSNDEALYRLELTNNGVPPHGSSSGTSTLVSEPIELKIGGADGTPPSVPSLSSPANGADGISISPELRWNSVSDASGYRLQVSADSDFSSTVVIEGDINTTQRNVSGLGYETIYYWRVRAVNSDGESSWSQPWSFTTESDDSDDGGSPPSIPSLSSPANSSTGLSVSPTLSWNSVSAASGYRLQVSVDSDFSSTVLNESDISTTQRNVSGLSYETIYYWRVRAVNSDGESSWSQVWSFTTESEDSDDGDNPILESPVQSLPSSDAEDVSLTPVFEWSAVKDADYYILHVSQVNPTGMVIDVMIDDTTFTPGEKFDVNTVYDWRVRGVKNGEMSEWSEIRRFTTGEEEELVNDASLSQNYPNPFNPTTQIEFSLNEMKQVSLAVYDMAGREVAVLVDGVLNAGTHINVFNADKLSSGIYFYRLVSGKKSYTKKMTLIK